MERKCKYCGKGFDVVGRIFSNHVRWCDENPARNNTANIKQAVCESYNRRFGELKSFPVKCNKCGTLFWVEERENKFPEKENYYCSRTCANSRERPDEVKEKVSRKLKGVIKVDREIRKCLECNNDFVVIKTSNQRFCSISCVRKNKRSDSEFLNYRHDCRFRFNLWKYPDEFDLDLIKKYGWYKAANRGNNLDGVSRDHRVSVMYGWENDIPASVISHPANCKLMQQNDNSSKNKKCSLVLQELMEHIKIWDEKYGG